MEKQAVIRAGKTPSEISGKRSDFIKNGRAVTKDELCLDMDMDEEYIASHMSCLENKRKASNGK